MTSPYRGEPPRPDTREVRPVLVCVERTRISEYEGKLYSFPRTFLGRLRCRWLHWVCTLPETYLVQVEMPWPPTKEEKTALLTRVVKDLNPNFELQEFDYP